MRLVRISELRKEAKKRPAGYYEDVLSKGRINGEWLEVSLMDYRMLKAKYSPRTTSVSSSVACCGGVHGPITITSGLGLPSVFTQIGNAASAVSRVVSASFTGNQVKATPEVIEQRRAICQGCEFLNNDRCSKCGCRYKLKITLATEKCPINRW